jgi:Cu+-exporting ATPase
MRNENGGEAIMKDTFNITGMTCASCAKAVERGVRKVEGIQSANVNLATEKLFVEYDEGKADLEKIKDAVKKAGYGAEEEKDKSIREIMLPISGMTCASCSNAVQRAIGKLDGIQEVNVNFATEKAKVVYDSSKTRISEIKDAVSKAGYKALEIESGEQVDSERERREKEVKTLWRKFIVSVIFAIPLLYIAMGHMMGLPIPEIITPHMHPLNFGLIQLLLAAPIIAAGYRFYTIGFSKLFRREPNMDSLIAIGTSAAILYGIYAILQILNGNTEYAKDLYFESAGVIIALILLGKYLESVTKGKTSEAIKKLAGI